MLIALLLAEDLPSKVDLWVAISAMMGPGMVFGWTMARHSRVEFDAKGIRVTNPVNWAFVPWAEVADVDEEGIGLLRIETRQGWSVRCWAVQASNWERLFDRPNRVELLAGIMREHVAGLDGAGDDGSARAVKRRAVKRWRLPLRPVVGALASVAVFGLLLTL